MSFVGPRPNVKRETDLYTSLERGLLDLRPGITDMASIVFADEGDILAGSEDPDLLYQQIIRPWKSRLGLLYLKKQSFILDLKLIFLTLLTLVSRQSALDEVSRMVQSLGGDERLVQICRRKEELEAFPPPGASEIVMSRDIVSELRACSQ